jgi:probable rRNA maturation factor
VGLDVEVIGNAPGAPPPAEVERLVGLALASAGIADGHVAVEWVEEERIQELNAEHRGKPEPTDVLSFPIDEDGDVPEDVPRELGDIVICADHTEDLREAVLHGALHLPGWTTRPTTARCSRSKPRSVVVSQPADAGLPTRASSRSPAARTSGKSTLVNAMVGRKVAIVSDKPQTTRRAIRGVATGRDVQLVLVDLPACSARATR